MQCTYKVVVIIALHAARWDRAARCDKYKDCFYNIGVETKSERCGITLGLSDKKFGYLTQELEYT